MRRTEFEERLNELLDAREDPTLDPQLCAAAEKDEECRAILASAEMMLSGLSQREPAYLSGDLAESVLHGLERPTPAAAIVSKASFWLPVSIAALVLISFLSKYILNPPATDPSIAQPANLASPEAAETGGALAGQPPRADLTTHQANYEIDDKAYFAMLRRTGQAIAILPDTLLRGDVPPEFNTMAEGMRPVRNSVSAALDALRGTLPSKSRESET